MTDFFTRHGTTPVNPAHIHDGFVTIVGKCNRCGGAGRSDRWAFTGYTCFDCGGHGRGTPKEHRVYTAEKLAKLNGAKAKADAKRAAVAKAKADAAAELVAKERDAWLAVHGATVETARALVSKSEFVADLIARLDTGRVLWTDGQAAAVAKTVASFAERARLAAATAFVGKVGDKVEVEVEVVGANSYERSKFNAHWLKETVNITTMRGTDGNVYVVKSPAFYAEKGEKLKVKGTIKEHSIYNETRQNVLTRAKAIDIAPKEATT